MTRVRARLLSPAALICLGGLGLMVVAGGRGTAPGPAWSVFFVLLTVVLAVLVAGAGRRDVPAVQGRVVRGVALAGMATLLVLGIWIGLRPASLPEENELDTLVGERLEAAAGVFSWSGLALDRLVDELGESGSGEAASGSRSAAAAGSGGFWQSRWRELHPQAALFPLEVVIWRDGQRVEWTAGALPLAIPAPAAGREFLHSRGTWILRENVVRDDRTVSCQVHFERHRLARRWSGLRLLPGVQPPAEAGLAHRVVNLGGDGSEPMLTIAVGVAPETARTRSVRAGRYVALVSVWFLVAVAVAWLLAGAMGALAAAWIGRFLAAGIDLHQWLAAAWPADRFPVPPDSLASLMDPAYFATPFGGGLFASTADALTTGLLLALSAVHLLRRRPTGLGAGGGTGHALLTGVAAGAALLAVRALVVLLAENANARLIGPGIPVRFVSFWILHLARLLLGFAPLALVTGIVAVRRPHGGWTGRLLVVVVAGLVLLAGGVPTPTLAIGAAGAGILWMVAPVLRISSPLRRRLVWPLVVLVATVWNYAVLREIYGAAERSWLHGKSQVIATADAGWSRFLLGDVLEEMQLRDAGGTPLTGIWRDEAAWRLWRESALRDLGLPCLVEVVDAAGDGVSLHTTGFLDDFQYEVSARGPWVDAQGEQIPSAGEPVFQTERRLYNGGEEEILVGEIERRDGRGWLRVDMPVRSWRISTLLDQLVGADQAVEGGYRPRAEIDREVMLWRADAGGLRDAGPEGFPDPAATGVLTELIRGERQAARITLAGRQWYAVWAPLPSEASRTPGEGFLLGLRHSRPGETLLDFSRLLLLDLVLFTLGLGILQLLRRAARRLGAADVPAPWRPGFQERFVGGTFVIGLVLLILLGAAVDRVSQEQIRTAARDQTRAGLGQAVDQLRSLLVEQARALAASEYIGEMLVGQFAGGRPLGPMRLQQAMIFGADGSLLLDETLSDLTPAEASQLLDAARRSPLVLVREGETLFVGTVIPIDLGGVLTEVALLEGFEPGGPVFSGGFFFYRHRLDANLLSSLAALVRGELTMRVDGVPVLASDPGVVFAGDAPLLAEPALMAAVAAHPGGALVFVDPARPFAPTGCQPLPVFGRDRDGELAARRLPGLLEVVFPDRARIFGEQRRTTALFLAGLVNLVLLGALALAVLMSWNIFRPLRLLMGATRSLARGDFAAPLPEAGHGEVGQLAEAFARMRDDLATAQERLAARERFLSAVLDRVTVGVAVVAADGAIVALNPTGREILADFRAGPAVAVAGEEASVAVLLDRFRTLTGHRLHHAGDLLSYDGQRTLRGAVAPLDLPDGRAHTMLVFEDVTEYLENQRLAINAELARQVAHEIKNPLTPIQLSAQLLQQAWRDDHPRLEEIVDDSVARILDQVELLRRIASEFSLLGRPGDLVTEPLDIAGLVEDTVAAYAGGEIAGTPAVRVAPEPPPPVLGEADSLRKILGNLMQNSLDAARPGGPVEIEVDWEIAAQTVTLRWRDRGTGVPEEVAGRLFDPYFSTKSKGTGLGLAICRNLTDRMGGRISLTNREDGPGAVATLTLRRADVGKDIS